MSKTTELVPVQPLPVAQPAQTLSIEEVFRAVIEKQISPDNVAVMRELLSMSAQQRFASAFVALQGDMPTIVAETVIPNRGKYARFEDVMAQIAPALKRHGFTVSFSQAQETGRVTETCHLTHEGGHTRSSSFAVRVAGKADSETQADVKAATTAKRKALQDALNIVIRQDCLSEEHDAALEGGHVTEAQAFELERRVALLNQDHSKFLKWLGAKSYAEISAAKYAMADNFLASKENK
jgi:hypothetical protein